MTAPLTQKWGRGLSGAWLAMLISLACTAVSVSIRPPLSPDETRYLKVAGEMRESGDWLVPHVNGAPYPDKPPLLFWIINVAWALAGTSPHVARAIVPLVGVGSLGLMVVLARKLWPDRREAGITATLVLAGSLAWALYASLVMFDALLTACVLVTLIGGVRAARGGGFGAWSLVTAGFSVGILAKGPILFLYILPALLLASLWWPGPAPFRAASWYPRLLLALGVGAVLALAWALPAAHSGGPDYANSILWKQTANRMLKAFAHQRPLWWYLPLLPVVLLPWSAWPAAWRALRGLRGQVDPGIRFCLVWGGCSFVALSLVSGKQVHYLLPLMPAFALLLGRALEGQDLLKRRDIVPLVAGLAALGLAMLLLTWRTRHGGLSAGMSPAFLHLRTAELVALGPVALAVLWPRPAMPRWRVAQFALAGVLTAVLLQASLVGWGAYRNGVWPPWT